MAKTTDWTGDAGNGLWSDPGNWSAGVLGRQATVTFDVAGQAITDVSLAPANFQHPVAGTVTMEAGSFVFEPGKLVIGQSGLTVENGASLTIARGAVIDARNSHGGLGVTVSSGTLIVHGALNTSSLEVYPGSGTAAGQMLISGTAARATVAFAEVKGAVLAVAHGAHLTATQVEVSDQNGTGGALYFHGAGTLVSASELTVTDSILVVAHGADLAIGSGSEGADLGVSGPQPSITVAGRGATLSMTSGFIQNAGTLTVGRVGHLFLQMGATFQAEGTVDLAGGTLAGPGKFTLNGGTLLATATETLRHDVGLGVGAGVAGQKGGTIEASTGNTLTLYGAITGPKLPLTIGSSTETGTVVLTNAADSYGPTQLAGGTLELAANDVTGTGNIRFPPGDTATLRVDAGVSVGNTVMGFAAGDTIDLAGIGYGPGTTLDLTPRLYGGANLTVSDGVHTEQLVLGTVGSPAGYMLSADGHGGTDIGYVPPQPG